MSDIQKLLCVCSRYGAGRGALHQPRFTWVGLADAAKEAGNAESERLAVPVCGPCSRTCFEGRDIVILEDVACLREPFECGCRCVRMGGHSCYWEDEVELGDVAVRALWAEQQKFFLAPIVADISARLRAKQLSEQPQFTQQLRSAISLFAQYRCPVAQSEALKVIPVAQLMRAAKEQPSYTAATEKDEIFKQLLSWFKDSFFKWVDSPQCSCGGSTTNTGRAAPPTPEETANWSTTTEIHECSQCRHIVRFPRYNKAQRLLTWRQGRCGEWTNCFLLLAISLGYECRHVLDFTDHVWIEVYSAHLKRWIHCDPCEKAFDTPLMYEEGWKKSLTYIFAFSDEECVDVIRRYSAKMKQGAGLPKRNRVSEAFVNALVFALDEEKTAGVSPSRAPFFRQRRRAEWDELLSDSVAVGGGPIEERRSGSEAWKRERGELGLSPSNADSSRCVVRELCAWRTNIDVVRVVKSGSNFVSAVGLDSSSEFLGTNGSLHSRHCLQLEAGLSVRLTFRGSTASCCSIQLVVGELITASLAIMKHSVLTCTLFVNWRDCFRSKRLPECYPGGPIEAEVPCPDDTDVEVQLAMDPSGGLRLDVRCGDSVSLLRTFVPLFGPNFQNQTIALLLKDVWASQFRLDGSFVE